MGLCINSFLSLAQSSGHLEPVVNSIVCGPEQIFFYLAHLPTSGSFSALPITFSGIVSYMLSEDTVNPVWTLR